MTDCGKGKTFRAAGGLSSNRLTDDGLNELNFQSALHILVHAHMGITVLVIERPGAELEYVALVYLNTCSIASASPLRAASITERGRSSLPLNVGCFIRVTSLPA